jgi:hypothetical protein
MLGVFQDGQTVLDGRPDVDRTYLIGAEKHIWATFENAMAGEDAVREPAISAINMLGE